MEKEELDFTLCQFDPANPGPYEQYILPNISAEMRQAPERFAALGAVWNNCAVGAAVITDDPDDPGAAALASLFVDPQVRRRGIGTALLKLSLKAAAGAGAERLTPSPGKSWRRWTAPSARWAGSRSSDTRLIPWTAKITVVPVCFSGCSIRTIGCRSMSSDSLT